MGVVTPSLTPSPLAIAVGTVGEASLIVSEEHTAARVGSGHIRVLATPVMINLMEAAALAACDPYLPEGYQSLGTRLDVSHVAATPVGMQVRACATVTAIEGRTVHFKLDAHDAHELVGEGVHERVVVNVAKFDARVTAKASRRVDD